MKKALIIGAGVLVVAVVVIGAIVLLTVSGAKAPYEINAEKISVANLKAKSQLGKYKLIQNGQQNPLEVDSMAISFLSVTGEPVAEAEISEVVVGTNQAELATVRKSLDTASCSEKVSGKVNNVTYNKAICGTTVIYIYSIENDRYAAFQLEGSEEDLKAAIADFVM